MGVLVAQLPFFDCIFLLAYFLITWLMASAK